MSKVKEWLRKWLGVDERVDLLASALKQNREHALRAWSLEREQRQAAVVSSQNFVPALNLRITALEQTSVNGLGVQAIIDGRADSLNEQIKSLYRLHDADATEISDLTKELEELNRRVIALEIKPKPIQETKEEPPKKRGWKQIQASIEAQERERGEKPSLNV